MSILFHKINLKKNLKNKSRIKKWIINTIESYNYLTGHINIILVDDPWLLQLNRDHLNRNSLTDIITFEFNEDKLISGDLYISLERVIENSAIYSNTVSEELLRVIIHGILHLIGFKDESPEQKIVMRKKEDKALFEVQGLEII